MNNFYLNRLKKVSFKELRNAYEELSKYLSFRENKEIVQTKKEDDVYKLLTEITRLKIYRSFWIGKRNFDFFIPSISFPRRNKSNKSSRGLIIEIDGPIHDGISKMNKDQTKLEKVHKLGIAVKTILNSDAKKMIVLRDLLKIVSQNRLDSRGKQRLLRDIYIETILSNETKSIETNSPKSFRILKEIGYFS